jgi:SAM-dependent methyltransferase
MKMDSPSLARKVLTKALGERVTSSIRRRLVNKIPRFRDYKSLFADRSGLEIGGPSEIFGEFGSIPIYKVLKSLDNCLYSSTTIWTGQSDVGEQFQYLSTKKPGIQFICEATELFQVKNESYECVLASHCLEHVANPLKALGEWKRVLRQEGLLFLLLPHKDGTFDWRRPVTTLQHVIQDFERQVGEDDISHLEEVLALHDLDRDKAAGSPEQLRQRCLQNVTNRAIHHHVFDTPTAIKFVDCAGFQVVRATTFEPHHIVIVARRTKGKPNNGTFLAGNWAGLRQSCFPSDRLHTK